jgi:hypothetical protein
MNRKKEEKHMMISAGTETTFTMFSMLYHKNTQQIWKRRELP